MIKTYDINWDLVNTVEDLKLIISILVDKVVIDTEKPGDLEVYAKIRRILINGNS